MGKKKKTTNMETSKSGNQKKATKDVPDEMVDRIASYRKTGPRWYRVSKEGFLDGDKCYPDLRGHISDMDDMLINWKEGTPTEIEVPVDGPWPSGYKLRVNLTLLVKDQPIIIPLAASSVEYKLAPYIDQLRTAGINPSSVLTRMWVETVSSKHGKYQMVYFERVDDSHDGPSGMSEEMTPVSDKDTVPEPEVPDSEEDPDPWP